MASELVTVRVTGVRELLEQAAADAGLPLRTWMRTACVEAAERARARTQRGRPDGTASKVAGEGVEPSTSGV